MSATITKFATPCSASNVNGGCFSVFCRVTSKSVLVVDENGENENVNFGLILSTAERYQLKRAVKKSGTVV